ncbi:MAG: sigma-70 family RNA polymerase sigma factor [Saprospiraceae bacterium]|nr:sigma-70 family RNA polymerase sigma factor [Saprospiraceae bacterium]
MDEPTLHLRLKELHESSFVWAMRCTAQDKSMAEDVIQTVYLKILEGKADFKGKSTFKTWLFSVIRYTAMDLLRSNQVRLMRRKKYGEQISEEHSPEPGGTEDLHKKLANLPLRQQQVLELRFFHALTLEEIAQVLEISIGSVRQHYDRGKKKMRILLIDKS